MKNGQRTNAPSGACHVYVASGPSQRPGSSAKSGPADVDAHLERLQRRRAARFLARLRRSVLPIALLLASQWAASAWYSSWPTRSPILAGSLMPPNFSNGTRLSPLN